MDYLLHFFLYPLLEVVQVEGLVYLLDKMEVLVAVVQEIIPVTLEALGFLGKVLQAVVALTLLFQGLVVEEVLVLLEVTTQATHLVMVALV
jgi:hypothetical protein